MANYYRTHKDVKKEEYKKQSNARKQLIERIKTPIKYDIYPTIVISNTDKNIEYELYNNRLSYPNNILRQGEYTFTGYNADSMYRQLYKNIFDLNKNLWEIPPTELATAYLDLYNEFVLFEQSDIFTYYFHIHTGDNATKARLTARKCGIDMAAGLQIANANGFSSAFNDYTGGESVYGKKSDFEKYADDLTEELNKGKESFESNDYFAEHTRNKLPCMYTMLNLFCGIYRDIFCFGNAVSTEEHYSPQMVKAKGFDEYKYRQNGGQNFDLGAILLFIGVALVFPMLAMADDGEQVIAVLILWGIPTIGVGLFNLFLGWNSQ